MVTTGFNAGPDGGANCTTVPAQCTFNLYKRKHVGATAWNPRQLRFNPYKAAAIASDSERLFNWAEIVYAQFFPKGGTPGTYQQYTYRYYPATSNYLATANGRVVVHNGRDWNFLDVGAIDDYLPLAAMAGY